MKKSSLIKYLIGAVLLMAVFGTYKIIEANVMGGESYYVQITTDGEKLDEKDDNGESYVDYRYQLTGYDEAGHERLLDFKANRARPLRKEAYLKVVYNPKKGVVTQWEEVKKDEVPQKAAVHLN